MKSLFLVLLVLVVVAKANHMHEGEGSGSGVGDETGVGALSCEAKEGCCEDALDCPGCCNPPYDNQCANIKGVSMNFCEITGTYFITGSSLDYQKYNLSQCPSANMAGNYPGQCQGTLTLNSKIRKLDLTGKPIAPYVPQPPAFVQIIRYAACGHVVVSINLDPRSNFAQLAEPFLYNAAIVARNEAGLAVVVCYAIYKAPIFFCDGRFANT